MTNLCIAYNSVSNPIFKAYMKTQQDPYMDSKEDCTEEQLMEVALNKYNIFIELEKM